MAGDAERMAALKRAYADVILNTAKESAVRILAAERRTLQWKQSSSLVKEDSVALILRLKALMDSRIKETESVNLSQATRIRELEVQLREANHTIHRLNSKLQKVSSELENQKSDKSESLQGKDTDDHIISQTNNPDEAASSQETVPHSTYAKYSNQKEPTKHSTTSDDSTGTPDLVSLILRNKEPEPFRNGCTQRIRALERNVLTDRDLPAERHALTSNVKQEAAICENELDEKYWLGDPILAAEMLIEVAKSLDSEEAQQANKSEINQEGKFSSWRSPSEEAQQGNKSEINQKGKFSSWRSPRRRRARKLLTKSCSTSHETEDHEQPDISNTKIAGKTGMPMTYERQGQRNADTTCSDEASVENKITSVDRNMKLNEFPDHVIPAILNTGRIMTRRSMKLHNVNSSNAGQVSIENDQVALTTHDCEEGYPLDGAIKEDAIECETMLKTPDHTVTGYSDTLVLKGNDQKIDTPSTDFCSKDEEPCKSSRLPAEVGNDRIVKYTFKRTRKRGSPDNKNKDVYLEGNKKLRKADKESALHEKPDRIMESTRDSRRLAQVARQLISLSERRW
ncbi:uncharacterized protein LOC122027894 isoform X1 [Zingiber officinale]|uniref:Uncharacterized protein n=2 Tax=Zingiber officinale TaxID=94328 RepID=A0A8J5CF25_ZINOF|nr:uncharacterized protein LOC122027894 isoform X1 [Zingiber officinale]KAG6474686.1 hypothetical protein ZIOFF_068624 [Zingiber officinale]